MLGKKLEPPIRMVKDEVLLRRSDQNHPKRKQIEDDYLIRRSGFYGEKSLLYYFSFLKEGQFVIYHGLRLQLGNYYFQIDFLLLSTFFSIIIENKNNTGKLVYNPTTNSYSLFNQEDKEEAFSDPIQQALRQKERLTKWLTLYQLPNIPIEYLVNFSNPSILLKSTGPTNIFSKLGRSDQLLPKIYEMEKKYKKEIISLKELKKINKMLLKMHTEKDVDILQAYLMGPKDIKPGVQCPFCDHIPMQRKHSVWECPTCKGISKDAHIKAVNDYFLLYGPKITLKELCEFLQINDRYTGVRIASSMDLHSTGTHRSRIYFPKDDLILK